MFANRVCNKHIFLLENAEYAVVYLYFMLTLANTVPALPGYFEARTEHHWSFLLCRY